MAWPYSCASQRYRRKWDREFESGLLQRRVISEPVLARGVASGSAWRVFLAALFGLPVGADLDLFRQCTGLDAPVRFEELNSFTTFANRDIAAESDPLSSDFTR